MAFEDRSDFPWIAYVLICDSCKARLERESRAEMYDQLIEEALASGWVKGVGQAWTCPTCAHKDVNPGR